MCQKILGAALWDCVCFFKFFVGLHKNKCLNWGVMSKQWKVAQDQLAWFLFCLLRRRHVFTKGWDTTISVTQTKTHTVVAESRKVFFPLACAFFPRKLPIDLLCSSHKINATVSFITQQSENTPVFFFSGNYYTTHGGAGRCKYVHDFFLMAISKFYRNKRYLLNNTRHSIYCVILSGEGGCRPIMLLKAHILVELTNQIRNSTFIFVYKPWHYNFIHLFSS